MCSCFRSNSVVERESRRKEELQNETLSLTTSGLNDTTVRIVHAGGRIEMYRDAIQASKLIQKYPGMCVALPDVFKRPHESLLSGDDVLLPGNKYIIIRSTTVEKLKCRHSRKGGLNEAVGGDEAILVSEEIDDVGDVQSEESICLAREFFVSKECWSNLMVMRKRVREKKRTFVPPIQRPRLFKEPEWEPSLTSIQEQEISP